MQREVTVASATGLHARPATIFVKAAMAAAPVKVTISKPGGKPLNAASALAVMSLGVKQGMTVVLAAEGDGAEAVLDELAALLETDLDADAPTTDATASSAASGATAAASDG